MKILRNISADLSLQCVVQIIKGEQGMGIYLKKEKNIRNYTYQERRID